MNEQQNIDRQEKARRYLEQCDTKCHTFRAFGLSEEERRIADAKVDRIFDQNEKFSKMLLAVGAPEAGVAGYELWMLARSIETMKLTVATADFLDSLVKAGILDSKLSREKMGAFLEALGEKAKMK